jgi:hypothetical protein
MRIPSNILAIILLTGAIAHGGPSASTSDDTQVFDHPPEKTYITMTQAQVEAAFMKSQKLKLPMAWDDVWQALGLPPEERLTPRSHMGAASRVDFSRWELTKWQSDGSCYTLIVIYRLAAKNSPAPAMIYEVLFAREYDDEKRPILIISDPLYYFMEHERIEKEVSPNKPPLRMPVSGTPAAGAPVAPPPGIAGR